MKSAGILILSCLFAVDLLFGERLITASTGTLCAFLIVQVVIGLAILGTASGEFTPFSFRFAYGLVFSLFHFGVVAFLATGLPIPAFMLVQGEWLRGQEFLTAIVISTSGFLAYCIGAILFASGHRSTGRPPPDLGERNAYGLVGLSAVIASLALWIFEVFRSGGVGLMVGDYATFLRATSGSRVGMAYFGFGLGMCLIPLGSRSARRIGFASFGIFAAVAIPLGLRGEVMFPFVIACVVAFRARGFRWQYFICVVLFALIMIGAAREVRAVGVTNLNTAAVVQSPAAGLAELGGSVRPVREVIAWDESGTPRRHGTTYVGQVQRTGERILGIPRPDAAQDYRIFNREIDARVGPIGGSPVAEAYRNFGQGGVILRMLLMGIVMRLLDRARTDSKRQLAIAGIVALPFLIEIRNDFTPVVVQLVIGLGLVLVADRGGKKWARRHPSAHFGGNSRAGTPTAV